MIVICLQRRHRRHLPTLISALRLCQGFPRIGGASPGQQQTTPSQRLGGLTRRHTWEEGGRAGGFSGWEEERDVGFECHRSETVISAAFDLNGRRWSSFDDANPLTSM